VSVTLGETTVVEGVYVPLGLLRVAVAPAGLPVDVVIDGVGRNQFGAYMFLEAGSYEVCGTQAVGFTSPACRTVTVSSGTQTDTTLTYTSSP
jgi:hypothetical protein